MSHDMVLSFVVVLGAGLLVGAALHDIAFRTVGNPLAAAIALCGVFAQALHGSLPFGILAALTVFVAAAFCWRRGWMGGGDVKLFGAAALLVPPGSVLAMIGATAIAGGGLSVVYLATRTRLPYPASARPPGLVQRALRVERWRLRRGGPLPYAVAIACGAVFVLSHGGLS